MHEYSIVRALISRVEAEARSHGALSVQRLQVRIGELAGVEPTLLASAFAQARARTICRNAALEIEAVPARWRCPRCDGPAHLAGGDEILLERIEMEVP